MQKKIFFDYKKTARKTEESILTCVQRLSPEIERIKQAYNHGYTTPYSFINAPSDKAARSSSTKLAELLKGYKPDVLVVIGIGGSNLGMLAVHAALQGIFYNDKKSAIKFYCADTIDNSATGDLLAIIEKYLRAKKICILMVISKSGETIETRVNAALFFNLIKKYYPNDFQHYTVIITDKESPLWYVAKENNYPLLEIPRQIGGRYSVFTAVGLLPLALLGVDIEELCAGALMNFDLYTTVSLENSAAVSAALLYNNCVVHDTFVFSPELALLGSWYRQLLGESLGKKFDRSGNIVERGITPTVSVGTVDLHSVAQLYLGGPRDKFTTFVTLREKEDQKIPLTIFSQNNLLAHKSISHIKRAIFEGVQAAYLKEDRPFVTIELDKTPQSIGNFLQMKMLEIVYLGYLMVVNPFDQPQVELYKTETQRLLAHE